MEAGLEGKEWQQALRDNCSKPAEKNEGLDKGPRGGTDGREKYLRRS